jgi:HPt (histidine-containing phosphotransfer) domain-containing protein
MIDLQSLTSLFDDEILVKKYLDRFAQEMPIAMQQLNAAWHEKNYHTLALHAHTLKSQFQYVNDKHAIATATDLEYACQQEPCNELLIAAKVHALAKHTDLLVAEIHRING